MLHSLLVSVASLVVAAPIPPRDAKPPEGPTPSIVTITEVNPGTGQLTYEVSVMKLVPVNETRVIEEGGVKKAVTVTVYKTVYETRRQLLAVKDVKASTGDGKALSGDEVLRRLGPGSAIVVFPSGSKIDPAYLKLFKPETVILVPQGK